MYVTIASEYVELKSLTRLSYFHKQTLDLKINVRRSLISLFLQAHAYSSNNNNWKISTFGL